MLVWLIAVLVACVQWQAAEATSYRWMVLAAKGSCQDATVPSLLDLVDFSDCSKLGGERATAFSKEHCEVDLCTDLGIREYIATGDVWTVGPEKIAKHTDPADKVMINIRAPREECELLTGRPHLEMTSDPLAENERYIGTISCQVALIRRSGTSKKQVTGVLPVAGVGKCALAATGGGLFHANPTDCVNIGGQLITHTLLVNLTIDHPETLQNFEHTYTHCYLHLCQSAALNCTPTERYETHQACGLSAALLDEDEDEPSITCSWELEQGMSQLRGSSITTGGSQSEEFSAEVSMSLMDTFSVSAGTSAGVSSYWSNQASQETVFTTTSYTKITTPVTPGTKVFIRQLVGICGGYRVATPSYSIQPVDLVTGDPCAEE